MHRILKILVAALVLLLGIPVILYMTADFMQPDTSDAGAEYELQVQGDSLRVCGNSFLLLNRSGHWEAGISGDAIDRGTEYGILCQDLLKAQEDAFVNQIHKLIPSERWVDFLHKLIIIFNRNMAGNIPEEYRKEISAISQWCTHEYDSYGSPYVRQLNYHAAHDIGHAMQEYMLVGCSSFACWGEESDGGSLIIGRNFDFYVGDEFARNKIVLFVEPHSGYRFASVSWPGMMGVVSGMNEKGLTITLNAAKGKIPASSAMPISLLARHILQYACNIEEAYIIARQFDTFVSESLLIGSAADGCAAIIEKSPDKTALFKGEGQRIVCTNHYQSPVFDNDKHNVENIATSDSPYRHDRLNELLVELAPVDVRDAADILRNRYGKSGADIGLGNEKSINQFIAHHSVIFEPEKLRFWVSASPWQLGEYVCYDLNKAFAEDSSTAPSCMLKEHNIPADSLAMVDEYVKILRYREQYGTVTRAIDNGETVAPGYLDEFIANNPCLFQVYNVAGDYEEAQKNLEKAVKYWEKALSLEIPRVAEREAIIRKIQKYDKR